MSFVLSNTFLLKQLIFIKPVSNNIRILYSLSIRWWCYWTKSHPTFLIHNVEAGLCAFDRGLKIEIFAGKVLSKASQFSLKRPNTVSDFRTQYLKQCGHHSIIKSKKASYLSVLLLAAFDKLLLKDSNWLSRDFGCCILQNRKLRTCCSTNFLCSNYFKNFMISMNWNR